MPRPKKCRRVGFVPLASFFAPMPAPGDQVSEPGEVTLTLEEVEALRLADWVQLEQADGAERMGVSRGTFQRIVKAAREKVADALLHGKGIRIHGGNYAVMLPGGGSARACGCVDRRSEPGSGFCGRPRCQRCGDHYGLKKERRTMRLAIATEGDRVGGHFGQTRAFTICDIEGESVKERRVVDTEGHQHGALVGFLARLGANAVIVGGLGAGAVSKLARESIEVYTGVGGTVEEAIQKYLHRELVPVDVEQVLQGVGSHGHGIHHHHGHHHDHGGCDCEH
ncbi:MAG: DUF134 domain-containing protein [Kyrpidia tusciae]|nr:NifB/NifX family molybdenum-iron cluster-binding protein [Kyrpidia tusciae]MBE3552944.1 DUF134 domain-containing protein [Kyrpidia tusciae]